MMHQLKLIYGKLNYPFSNKEEREKDEEERDHSDMKCVFVCMPKPDHARNWMFHWV